MTWAAWRVQRPQLLAAADAVVILGSWLAATAVSMGQARPGSTGPTAMSSSSVPSPAWSGWRSGHRSFALGTALGAVIRRPGWAFAAGAFRR